MAPCLAISVATLVVIPLPTAAKPLQSAACETVGTSAAKAAATARDFIEIDISSSWRAVFVWKPPSCPRRARTTSGLEPFPHRLTVGCGVRVARPMPAFTSTTVLSRHGQEAGIFVEHIARANSLIHGT